MSKRALLVGCCYPGTKVELHGCANDVKRMQQSLVTRFGFDESDILVMLDTDPSCVQPTGANIRSSLQKLIKGVEPGDLLVFHYSGHGTQVPPEDGSPDETGKEEAIVPTDMNLLTDDDFRELVDQIPGGAQFVFLSDSCHSGGLIDAEKEQIGGTTTGYVGSGQGGGGHASAGGQDGGGGGGGLMGLVSQGLQAYGGGRGEGGGGAGGMMGMVSQGMAALGNRDIQTRDFEYPGAGGGRRRDDEGYGEGSRYEGEGYGEDRIRRTEGYGEDAYEGRRRYGEEEYEDEGRRRRGGDEEYEGEGRRSHHGGRRHHEEGEYEGEGRIRRPEEGYGGEAYEEGSGYEGRRQQAGYGGYGGSEEGGYGGGEGGYGGYGGSEEGGYGYRQQQASLRSRSKEIPVAMLTQILSERTGHKVDIGNIRTTIFDMFGDQASPTVKMFVNVVLQQLQQGGGGAQSGWMGTVSSLATQFLGSKLDSQDPDAAANYARPAESAGPLLPRRQRAGKSTDVGILLSGCQSDETSADATPGHNSAQSYGAFSNAVQTVLSQNDNPLSNRELVVEVRKVLAQQGFKQHPCLYCSDENADAIFLGHA